MKPNLLIAALIWAGCAHTTPEEMTASEHRAEAVRHQEQSEKERARYDPADTREQLAPRSPFVETSPGLHPYNPTVEHLNAADRELKRSFDHLKAAQALEKFEDVACKGISPAERTACPLLAPFVDKVEEVAEGLTLHLKATAPAQRLATQMNCHLAFANANGFDRAPCPLYVKGVKIALRDELKIEVHSQDAKVADEVRIEARKLFGEPVTQEK